ncbi:MAG: hypothetical protein VW268_06400 [Rhodospirillaceae bacterium]
MTLPSEGINPWRAHSAPNAGAPVKLPPQKIETQDPAAAHGPAGLREAGGDGTEFKPFGDDGVTFWDLIDIVNPLQHIPVVSTVYRDLTEDQLDPAPRVLGGTLFLGPIGLATSLINVAVEHSTGQDVGQHVMAHFRNDSEPFARGHKTASAAPVAGTDGVDPVTAWAQDQTAFYKGGAGQQDSKGDDVIAWARAQNAYYRGGDRAAAQTAAQTETASETADVAAWVAQQAVDVTDWARAQTAYYQGGGEAARRVAARPEPAPEVADVAAWAAKQHAFYRVDAPGANPAPVQVAAATDDVAAWAQSQQAFYRGDEPATEVAEQSAGPVAAGTDGIDPASAWAEGEAAWRRDRSDAAGVTRWAEIELAWIHGNRTREMAHAAQPANESRDTGEDRRAGSERQTGAIAGEGGWFKDNMMAGWAKYQAARHHAEPGYRPDLAVRPDAS